MVKDAYYTVHGPLARLPMIFLRHLAGIYHVQTKYIFRMYIFSTYTAPRWMLLSTRFTQLHTQDISF